MNFVTAEIFILKTRNTTALEVMIKQMLEQKNVKPRKAPVKNDNLAIVEPFSTFKIEAIYL